MSIGCFFLFQQVAPAISFILWLYKVNSYCVTALLTLLRACCKGIILVNPSSASSSDHNKNILVNLDSELVPKNKEKVSVYDLGFILGDEIWNDLRLYHARLM